MSPVLSPASGGPYRAGKGGPLEEYAPALLAVLDHVMSVEQRLGKRCAAQRARQRVGPPFQDVNPVATRSLEEFERPAVRQK